MAVVPAVLRPPLPELLLPLFCNDAALDEDAGAEEVEVSDVAAATIVVEGLEMDVTTIVVACADVAPAFVGVCVTTDVMIFVVGAAAAAETMDVTTLVVSAGTVVVLAPSTMVEEDDGIVETIVERMVEVSCCEVATDEDSAALVEVAAAAEVDESAMPIAVAKKEKMQ